MQWGLFGGAIENLGTERHHKAYVRRLIDLDLLGCFAMTETGHGSDVQSLETTATYDAATQEFVIHSPTPTARKDYIGGAAETARVAAVFAQLITPDGEGHGVHCLVVPIRDDMGNDMPGVTTSDSPLQGRPTWRRQRPHRVRPRTGSAGEPAEPLRRCRARRHVHLTDREPGAPVLPRCWGP